MGDGHIREDLLEAAHSLNAVAPDKLTIAALCKRTGRRRTEIRRYFRTNGALKSALSIGERVAAQAGAIEARTMAPAVDAEDEAVAPETAAAEASTTAPATKAEGEVVAPEMTAGEAPTTTPAADAKGEAVAAETAAAEDPTMASAGNSKRDAVVSEAGQASSEAPAVTEDWQERRFRMFERALSLLEARTEEAAREQSQAIALLEERLSNRTPNALTDTELPPFANALPQLEQWPEFKKPIEIACDLPLLGPLTSANTGSQKPPPVFRAREKVWNVIQGHNSANQTADPEREALKPVQPWLISGAIAAAALLLCGYLLWFGNLNPAKHAPVVHAAKSSSQAANRLAANGQTAKGQAAKGQAAKGQAAKITVIDATGSSTDPNYHRAASDIQETVALAAAGDPHAQAELASAYLRGNGVDQDPVAAIRWSEAGATQGDPNAQFILGSLYAEGLKANPQLAFKWFSAAAAQGHAKAMHNLAIAYLNGQGVAKNSVTAVRWLVKAANAGYRDSAFDLAVLYERGEGVPRDPTEALRWYNQAASLGNSEAADRAKILRSQLSEVAAQ